MIGATGGELELRFDPASEKRFHDAMEKFYKTGPEAFHQVLAQIRTMTLNHIRARSYSARTGSSIGIGPGKNYGHVRDSLQGRFNNIGWGGYVRINFKAGGKGFVARFHEFGTNDRYTKKKYGDPPHPKFVGKLPARGPMAAGYASMDQAMIERGLSDAIDKAIK